MLTIIYYTDNSLPEPLASTVRNKLLIAAEGKPIVSVSQEPIDFGTNVCVGDIGRSLRSMFYQTLIGAEAAVTDTIAMAEHDCLYVPDHFNWTPLRNDTFYYNNNLWYGHLTPPFKGKYSWGKPIGRTTVWQMYPAMSQLICNRLLFISAIKEKIRRIDTGQHLRIFTNEPGVRDGSRFRFETFSTEFPNIDLRHSGNYTGHKHGKGRAYTIPFWGSLEEAMSA